jgi:hypothetical protein
MGATSEANGRRLVELFVHTGEVERLAELVRATGDNELREMSHFLTEAAETLEKTHPELGARLWRAEAMTILEAKKSKACGAALSKLERARDCYERAGLAADWDETVRVIRAAHRRKSAFIDDFEALAAGVKRGHKSSFLERAKLSWSKRYGDKDEEG